MKKIAFALTLGLIFLSTGVAAVAETAQLDTEVNLDPSASNGDSVAIFQNGKNTDYEVAKTESNISLVKFAGQTGVLATNVGSTDSNIAAALATDGELDLAWKFANSSQLVQVLVNGQYITGAGAGAGAEGVVSIPLPDNELDVPIEISQAVTSVSGVTSFSTVSLVVAQPTSVTFAAGVAAFSTLASSPASSTVLRYQTFIPYQWVPVPSVGCNTSILYTYTGLMYEYGGNNRTYDPTTSNNKTAMQVNIDWFNSSVTVNKSVGDTNIYSTNGVTRTLISHPNAGTTGMQTTYGTFYANSLYVHLKHDIANPDCPSATGIYYDVTGQIYRTGGYSLSGQFRQAPNHEFYVRDSNTQRWDYIYRSDINSTRQFTCFDPSVSCITSGSWTVPNSIWYHP